MLVCLITDTHAGVRNDNIALLDHQKLFYDQVFFPYLKANKINTVVHLGDIVDRRKYINYNTLKRLREDFLEPLDQTAKDIHFILGNHDVYYKDTNKTNCFLELLQGKYPNFKLYYDNPSEAIFADGSLALMVPWICRENLASTFEAIYCTRASTLIGHLELQGFEMYKGAFCNKEDAIKPERFDKFISVLSGHFHHKSDYKNIHYLGCPFQMDWGDYTDTKGFHIFDTQSHDLTFIPNPYSLFYKVEYDDKGKTMDEVLNLDLETLRKSFVRVMVRNKENTFWFETFRDKIDSVEPLSVQVIEDMGHLAFDGDEAELLHVEDTLTLLSKYCDQIGVGETMKPQLNELLHSLYSEANNNRM